MLKTVYPWDSQNSNPYNSSTNFKDFSWSTRRSNSHGVQWRYKHTLCLTVWLLNGIVIIYWYTGRYLSGSNYIKVIKRVISYLICLTSLHHTPQPPPSTGIIKAVWSILANHMQTHAFTHTCCWLEQARLHSITIQLSSPSSWLSHHHHCHNNTTREWDKAAVAALH